jgi:hypothetical protein
MKDVLKKRSRGLRDLIYFGCILMVNTYYFVQFTSG